MKAQVTMFMTLLISLLSAAISLNSKSSTSEANKPVIGETTASSKIKDPFAGVSQDFSRLDGYTYEGGLDALPSEPENVVDRLKDFMFVLGSFIHDTVFEFTEFRLSADIFKARLASIQRQADSETPWDKDAAAQLKFADYMLRVMDSSAELLRFYGHDSSPAHRLIHKTIQLNVKLLTLFDSYGTPNPAEPNYQGTVTRLFSNLNAWGTTFMNLDSVTVSLLLAFHNQYTHAKNTIRELARYMPDDPEGYGVIQLPSTIWPESHVFE